MNEEQIIRKEAGEFYEQKIQDEFSRKVITTYLLFQ